MMKAIHAEKRMGLGNIWDRAGKNGVGKMESKCFIFSAHSRLPNGVVTRPVVVPEDP